MLGRTVVRSAALSAACVLATIPAGAATIEVSTFSEFMDAVGGANPGDVIEVEDT